MIISFATKTLFIIPVTLVLLCIGIYSYYRVVEHVIYKTTDNNTHLTVNVTCKYGGGETYYSYVLIQTPNRREVGRSELCCGQDTLDLCINEYEDITGLKLDQRSKTVHIDFSTKPPMEISVPFSETYLAPTSAIER